MITTYKGEEMKIEYFDEDGTVNRTLAIGNIANDMMATPACQTAIMEKLNNLKLQFSRTSIPQNIKDTTIAAECFALGAAVAIELVIDGVIEINQIKKIQQ